MAINSHDYLNLTIYDHLNLYLQIGLVSELQKGTCAWLLAGDVQDLSPQPHTLQRPGDATLR